MRRGVQRQNLQYSDIQEFFYKSWSATCEKYVWKSILHTFKIYFKIHHFGGSVPLQKWAHWVFHFSTILAYPLNDIMISQIHTTRNHPSGLREVRTPYCTQINNTCVGSICTENPMQKFTQLLVKKKTCQAKAKGSMCVTHVWGWDLCRVYMHGEPNAEIYTMKLLVKKKTCHWQKQMRVGVGGRGN